MEQIQQGTRVTNQDIVWPQHIIGTLQTLGIDTSSITFQWNSKGHTLIELDILWYIVKTNLLWFLWCQHCKYKLNKEIFYLEVTLLNAWRTTMFIGMEVKRDI